jgi:hypothetical protein
MPIYRSFDCVFSPSIDLLNTDPAF